MSVRSLVLLIGGLNGLLLAWLIASIRVNRRANLLLASLILLLSLRLGPYVLGFMGAYDSHPWLTFFPFDLSFAFGPLLWAYVMTLTQAPPRRLALHFIPAGLQLGYWLVCFALPLRIKWDWYTSAHLRLVAPLGLLACLAATGLYLWLAFHRYGAYRRWLDGHYANRDEARLTWLGLLLAVTGLAIVVAIGFAMVSWFISPLNYFQRFPMMLVFCALGYALGLLGWRHGAATYPPMRPAAADEGVPPSTDYALVAETWSRRVREAGWVRDEALTLESLAGLLATSPRTLSRVLNQGLGRNFNSFVNGIRVEAVVADMQRSPATRDLLTMALDAGFNSKASFNRAFRAHLQQTPSAYRERLKLRQSDVTTEVAATTGPA